MQLFVGADISRGLEKFKMVRDESKAAIRRALNTTITQARTDAARQIVNVGYGIKVSKIRAAIKVTQAKNGILRAYMTGTGKPIPLINYGARQTRKGVTVSVKNGRKLIVGAFIQVMPSGHRGVFIRKGGTEIGRRGKAIKNRHLAHELFGPSIPEAISNQAITDAVNAGMRTRFPRNLDHELNYLRIKAMN